MVLTHTPICDFGLAAPDFKLLGIDGKQWTRDDCTGENGLLVMFICNHCPYVKSIQDKLVADVISLQAAGIGVVAIMSNDPTDYQEDSYENMQKIAAAKGFTFPYLIDTTQQVAKSYDAVCTPDFFGYNSQQQLQYRGRLDESGANVNVDNVERELLNAMLAVAETGNGPQEQVPSMGCSIKWS
jgi:peroxiredoxin